MPLSVNDSAEQVDTHRYVVQVRRRGQDYFESDCAFRDGQLGYARYHLHLVLATLEYLAEGRVLDTKTQSCVYRYPPRSESEKQKLAIFGDPEDVEDLNGSGGVDDDPFSQYDGPDDPELRYS